MSLQFRLIVALVLVLAVIAGWWRLTAHYDNLGYQRAKAEYEAAADAQEDRNRELQRAAEKRYTVAGAVREKFFVKTVREIRHDTSNLAACVLTPAAVRRLHDAAACASGDTAAACGPDQSVSAAEPAP